AKLLANLSSLGRAEGWVRAELVDEQPAWNCAPAPDTDANPVPVFCPDPATAFDDEQYPTLDPKKLAKGKVSPSEFLWDCPPWPSRPAAHCCQSANISLDATIPA